MFYERCQDTTADTDKQPEDALVPVFFNGLPAVVTANVMRATGSKGLVDLAGGMGEGCKAAMSLRKPCLALCLSEIHVRLLFDHLVDWMLTAMMDQTSVFCNQTYKTFKGDRAEIKVLPLPLPSPTKPADLTKKRSKSAKNHKAKKRRKSGGKRESSSSDSSSAD